MDYEDWQKTIPQEIKSDSLWKVTAYRFALYLADLGWYDATKLMKDRRTVGLSDQLYRALGSICANIEEGYSRGTGRDRARFYEYALGSTRESRGWYHRGHHVLGEIIIRHRLKLLTEIIRLLMTMVPQQRSYKVSDVILSYDGKTESAYDGESVEDLLKNVPLPE